MTVRSVVVTGNCNAGGIVEGLRAVMPDLEVAHYAPWDLASDEQCGGAASAIAGSDAWLRMSLPQNGRIAEAPAGVDVVDLPNVVFSAFHPDVIYALRGDGSLFSGITDYHSAIGLWAWRQGLGPDEAARLFTPDVMRMLTYHRYWEPSLAAMKNDFAHSSLSFHAFWMRLKRSGVFMHTINHPTGPTLALLAKAIAVRIGAPADVWDIPAERYTQDFLSHIVWPVYPWVGTSLGIEGSFLWKMDDHLFGGVEEWLGATWDAYGNTPRDDVHADRIDDGVYDLVLGSALDALGIGAPS